jgi:DivIVA domain-containing protein
MPAPQGSPASSPARRSGAPPRAGRPRRRSPRASYQGWLRRPWNHAGMATLSAKDVERVQFSTTRARPGYDPAQVDRFLDLLADELRRYEQR